MTLYRILSLPLLALMWTGCKSGHKVMQVTKAPKTSKVQTELADYTRDWLRYRVYLQPATEVTAQKDQSRALKLSIRVINIKDNSSPLRRLCSNLDEYNFYYEYLLNSAKEEIYLQGKNGIKYPVFYAFENNYNAFPFETINLGYTFSGREQLKDYRLIYIDRVFAKDTLVFSLNSPKQ